MPNYHSKTGDFRCGECGVRITMFVVPDDQWDAIKGDNYALCRADAEAKCAAAGITPRYLDGEEAQQVARRWKLPEIWQQERP